MTKPLRPISDAKTRCGWVGGKPHFIAYHDREWGVPVHDDRKHFEMLLLEGAQAGLTWETILLRRDGYRRAFAEFDPTKVARFTAKKKTVLLKNPGIIRNRLKIDSAVTKIGTHDALPIGYRRAFAEFDPTKVARFTAKKKTVLLKNPGIIRNRLKIDSAVT